MNRIALALIAGAFVATAAAAAAQSPAGLRPEGGVQVRIGDLDLTTAVGADAFDRRVVQGARSACGGRAPLAAQTCRSRVTRELRDALPDARRDDYARARSGTRILAMVPAWSA